MQRLFVGTLMACAGVVLVGVGFRDPRMIWAGLGLWLILVGVRTLCDRD